MKEIKEKVKALAKKQKVEVTEWTEKEGYEYLWEKEKK